MITSLSLSKVMVIRQYLIQGAGLPQQKGNTFYIKIGRYIYHKNLIINKGFLPLVGIVDCFTARAPSSHCRNNVAPL
jgi:hypothetical protein